MLLMIGGCHVGHERIGFLPKTKQWQAIVEELQNYDGDISSVSHIANATLDCLRAFYKTIALDESMIDAVRFLTTLCLSASSASQQEYLNLHGFIADDNLSLLSLLQSVNEYIRCETGSLEINKMIRDSVMQALIDYKQRHETERLRFIEFEPDNIWRDANRGAAFCEIARSFIAAYTNRQLRYFLERAAAGSLRDYSQLVLFSKQLTLRADLISQHTFEISKLMQSFAAGWYNKYSAKKLPPDSEISRFLSIVFGKLREEYRRETLES